VAVLQAALVSDEGALEACLRRCAVQIDDLFLPLLLPAANHGSICSLLQAMDGLIVCCGVISSCQLSAVLLVALYVRSTIASIGLYLLSLFICLFIR